MAVWLSGVNGSARSTRLAEVGHDITAVRGQIYNAVAEYCGGELSAVAVGGKPATLVYWQRWGRLLFVIAGIVAGGATLARACSDLRARWVAFLLAGAATIYMVIVLGSCSLRGTSNSARYIAFLMGDAFVREQYRAITTSETPPERRVLDIVSDLKLVAVCQRERWAGAGEEALRRYVIPIGDSGEDHGMLRQLLWEVMAPRVKRANENSQVVGTIVTVLRGRFAIGSVSAKRGLLECWTSSTLGREEFEAIYTAAIRAVGVPARLGADGYVEFWDGKSWRSAPRPLL